MKLRFVLGAVIVSVVGCATNTPPAALPVPPAEPVSPAPPLPPTLSVSVNYLPELTLTVKLDGKPVQGEVIVSAVDVGVPLADSGSGSLTLTAVDGRIMIEAASLHRLHTGDALQIRIAGAWYPIPQPTGSSLVSCAEAIGQIRRLSVCKAVAPDPSVAPSLCDEAGQGAWRGAIRDHGERGRVQIPLCHTIPHT